MRDNTVEVEPTIGRWQSPNSYRKSDLSEQSLREIAQHHFARIENAKNMGHQVLVWECHARPHNLLAVWTADTDKLVVF